jgi:hypothetical protein
MTQTQTPLSPRLRGIADKVAALTRISHESGFSTKRTIRELLTPLTTEELVAVSTALYGQPESTTR